ncbi:MAG: hypothetical protein AAF564_19020 [Bacteroidota bacterium]
MGMTFWGREHALLNAKLLDVLEHCKISKKLGKKVGRHKVPLKIKKYPFILVFTQPAKVVNIDRVNLKVDLSMSTALYALDGYYPDGKGTSTIRYTMSYEGYSKKLYFRGATLIEMSFAGNMFDALKTGMKKKAGKLNLELSVKDCFS